MKNLLNIIHFNSSPAIKELLVRYKEIQDELNECRKKYVLVSGGRPHYAPGYSTQYNILNSKVKNIQIRLNQEVMKKSRKKKVKKL
jgi:hypothetical protein